MDIIDRIYYAFSPIGQFSLMRRLGFYDQLDDRSFIERMYKAYEGKQINLECPKELNEKIQWLKLYNRNPIYTTLSDKVLVKKYVAKMIGNEYVIPTIGVWKNVEDINFDKLPPKFVIKCNHNSGTGMYICKNKQNMDIKLVKHNLLVGMKEDYFLRGREWVYKNIPRRIIAEKLLENGDGSPIVDYKFYCYGGVPRYFMYSIGEASHNVKNHKFNMNGQSIDNLFKKKPTIEANRITLPSNLDKMIEIVEVLCNNEQHVRIDMYNVNNRIYFGEMTFYSGMGFINILDNDYRELMASYIDINKIRKCIEV